MPRFRRIIRPGDLVHVISRFVNCEFRLTGPVERHEYLRRFGKGLEDSDWNALSYALMSSHLHFGLLAGEDSFERLIKGIHAPFAGWLNRRQGRRGPVFAERPSTIIVHPSWAPRLIAYHHNNPPRAGVVATALESDWTSHRAYLGEVEPPSFLSVDLGLDVMGFGHSRSGRDAFARYVQERQDDPRDTTLSADLRRAKARLRQDLGAAVCIAHPHVGPRGTDYAPSVQAVRWTGPLATLIEAVASARRVTPVEIASSSRRRDLVGLRRQVALVAGRLGRTDRQVGLALGISETAVRKLRKSAADEERAEAAQLLEALTTRPRSRKFGKFEPSPSIPGDR